MWHAFAPYVCCVQNARCFMRRAGVSSSGPDATAQPLLSCRRPLLQSPDVPVPPATHRRPARHCVREPFFEEQSVHFGSSTNRSRCRYQQFFVSLENILYIILYLMLQVRRELDSTSIVRTFRRWFPQRSKRSTRWWRAAPVF